MINARIFMEMKHEAVNIAILVNGVLNNKMINIKDLNGNLVKKRLNAFRCGFRWHNKNKSGGNFGINIYFEKEFNRDKDKEITGYYNIDGNIYNLCFSPLYSAGGKIPIWALNDLDTLFNYIQDVIKWESGLSPSPNVRETELLATKEQLNLIGFEV